jgi:hypothetical protein
MSVRSIRQPDENGPWLASWRDDTHVALYTRCIDSLCVHQGWEWNGVKVTTVSGVTGSGQPPLSGRREIVCIYHSCVNSNTFAPGKEVSKSVD